MEISIYVSSGLLGGLHNRLVASSDTAKSTGKRGNKNLLVAFDQATLGGQRDYAIARCFIDLGLRTAEILRLALDDILWTKAIVQIRGKGSRVDAMPLPAEAGDAIARYLKNRVSKSRSLSLFHRLIAPFEKPFGSDMIRGSIRNAASRCGLSNRMTSPIGSAIHLLSSSSDLEHR